MFKLPQGFLTSFLKSQFTKLPYPDTDLTGKTIIVTGANVGLGLEVARHFSRLNATKVIIGVRNVEKGQKAKADIEMTTGRKDVVEVWQVDLNSYESVKKFCHRTEALERLDIVVENAGIATPTFTQVEGMESTIQTNVIATFLMALLLLPILRANAEKHNIVPVLSIVASDAHFQAVFPEGKESDIFAALNTPGNQADRYNTSKLLEIFMVRELYPAMDATGKSKVILNCVNPGLCESELMRHASIPLAVAARIGKLLIGRSTEVGSRTLFSGAVAGQESHGKYMGDCKVMEPSAFVRSQDGKTSQKRVYDELLAILEKIQPGIKTNI